MNTNYPAGNAADTPYNSFSNWRASQDQARYDYGANADVKPEEPYMSYVPSPPQPASQTPPRAPNQAMPYQYPGTGQMTQPPQSWQGMQDTLPPGEDTDIYDERGVPEYTADFLRSQIGKLMKVEFHFGNQSAEKTGRLLEVGTSFIVLQSLDKYSTVMCDLYAIRFVTIVDAPLGGCVVSTQ